MLTSIIDELDKIDDEISIPYYKGHHGYLLLKKKRFIYKKIYRNRSFNEENIQEIQDLCKYLYTMNNKVFSIPYSIVIEYYPYILMDYYSGSNLEFIMEHQEKHAISQTEKLIIAYGIAKALSILHLNDLIHNKFTLSSVLIDENFYPVISKLLFHCKKDASYKSKRKNIDEYIEILSFIDKNTKSKPLFDGIIENVKHDKEETITFDTILEMLNELDDNRNLIDSDKFHDYINFIDSNKEVVKHGNINNVEKAASNGLINAIETIDLTLETLKEEEIIQ